MAWLIDRDYLDPSILDSDVGTGSFADMDEALPTYRFRIRDDDHIVYYGGSFNTRHGVETPGDNSLAGALAWASSHAGATDLQVRAADAERLGYVPAALGKLVSDPDGWVTLLS